MLDGIQSYEELTPDQRNHARRLLMCISDTANAVAKLPETSSKDASLLKNSVMIYCIPLNMRHCGSLLRLL